MRDLTTRSRVLLSVTALTSLVIAYNLKLTTGADAKQMRILTVAESVMPPNLLLAKWEGPYGGVPPFDRVKVADFKPALERVADFKPALEFPSQLLEHWLSTPEVLQRFAVHYQTGKPIPLSLVERIKRAATFNEGFITVEYLSAALVDMKLHLAGDKKIDADAFEKATLAELGMPNEIVMRHRTPQFLHVFASDGYSAGYYSYLWSDVLTADAYGAFVEAGGPYDHKVAERLRKYIFSVGNTVDPAEAYRSFRGRDPRTEALMKKRGFSGAETKTAPGQ